MQMFLNIKLSSFFKSLNLYSSSFFNKSYSDLKQKIQEQVIYFVSTDVWNTVVSSLLNPQSALSQKDFEKVKRSPESKSTSTLEHMTH